MFLVDSLIRKTIGKFIAFNARMTFNPLPGYFMPLRLVIELLPQIDILDRLFRSSFPTILLPLPYPFLHTLHDIFGVGQQLTLQGRLKACSPSITAVSSILLLVVSAS